MEKHEFSTGYVQLIEKDILYVRFNSNKLVTLNEIKEIISIREKIHGTKPYYNLADFSHGIIYLNTEAKKFLAENHPASKMRIAEVIVIEGIGQRIEANLYFKIFKPKNNSKAFPNYEKALAWLRQERDKDLKK